MFCFRGEFCNKCFFITLEARWWPTSFLRTGHEAMFQHFFLQVWHGEKQDKISSIFKRLEFWFRLLHWLDPWNLWTPWHFKVLSDCLPVDRVQVYQLVGFLLDLIHQELQKSGRARPGQRESLKVLKISLAVFCLLEGNQDSCFGRWKTL